MRFTINLNDTEQALIENYAKKNNLTIEQALKAALFELIEDAADLQAGESAYREFLLNPVTYSGDEVWAEDPVE